MHRHTHVLTMLVAGTIASFCLAPAVTRAELRDSDREEAWEFYIPIRYLSSQTIAGEGGSTATVNSDYGWGFGFGYNLSGKLNVGFEFTWLDASYDANLQSADTPPEPAITLGGTLEASTGMFTGQYNFMEKSFTPFVNAGLGWSYVDSNIPSGPVEGFCWWTWYGYVCDAWQPTHTDTSFAYTAGAGVRGELGEAFYVQAAYSYVWIDFDGAGTTDFSGVRVNFGWKF